MQKINCGACIKAYRRYGKLDFSTTEEDYRNKLPAFGCQCISAYYKKDSAIVIPPPIRHPCSFCDRTFPTAIKLFYHSNNEHTMNSPHDDYDFYSVVGKSILGNLDSFYYDQEKLYKLSSLIDALQMNISRIKRLSTIEE